MLIRLNVESTRALDEKKGRRLDFHDAPRDFENRRQQLARLGDRVDQGADLDQALVQLQLTLERNGGKRHRARLMTEDEP